MKKMGIGLSTFATFAGMVWGIFWHPLVILTFVGLIGGWVIANWSEEE